VYTVDEVTANITKHQMLRARTFGCVLRSKDERKNLKKKSMASRKKSTQRAQVMIHVMMHNKKKYYSYHMSSRNKLEN
jgi:hypothetical protein